MKYFIGLDIGTSSVKGMLISEEKIIDICSLEYPLSFPKPGYSEQNPVDWYKKSIAVIKKLTEKIEKEDVCAISFSGQMHGLVMLDESDCVIRPAILWNDGRSEKEVAYLNHDIGREFLLEATGNIAFAGFTAPKLLWVYTNEPDYFNKAKKICLPKDYVAYCLSGVFATDVSDAAGTLYFDTEHRCWSQEMLALLQISEAQLPAVFESNACIGTLKKEIADELGLPDSVKIIIGAGDNAASAIGTGTVRDGDCNISLGTSGTVFVCSDTFCFDKKNAIHAFCSANGKYHYLACTLTAASSQKWLIEDILKTDYSYCVDEYIGKSDVLFLPYLMGERSPVNDTSVRGVFAGLSMHTTREEMILAVLEGVAFSFKQNIDAIRALGVDIRKSKICGGGAKMQTWLQILADVLDIEISVPVYEHGGALGAAILAAEGSGYCISDGYYAIKKTVVPNPALRDYYGKKYEKYLKLYPMASKI